MGGVEQQKNMGIEGAMAQAQMQLMNKQGEKAEADLAAAMNKVVGTLPKLESPADNNGKEVERHEIRRDVFVPCSWVTRKPSEKKNRCKTKTMEGTLLSELCPSQCS